MRLPVFSVLVSVIALPASASVLIDYVTVGDAGNAADPATGFGAVAYSYNMARNETTIGQYTDFLNATAQSDPYGLYNGGMASDSEIAGIARSGTNGNYTYSVIGSANRPITYVSWFDAARFVNWLSNGQGTGSTETGVYNLNGAMAGIFNAQPGASVWLPTEDEWYKAAYYDPTKNGGVGGYWTYANRSDTLTSNTIGVAGAGNFKVGIYAADQNGLPTSLTDVGVYGAASASYYGTNDQTGNVWEWNDGIVSGTSRELRGGSWHDSAGGFNLRSSSRLVEDPSTEAVLLGFRVASVPEPSTLGLISLFGSLCVIRRKRGISF